MPPLSFDALEPIEKRIRQVRADIGYITLSEVVDRVKSENIGRIDLTETDLAPYAFDPEPPEFEEAGLLGDLGDAALPGDEALRLAEAACRWVRETVTNNMHGQEEGRFRIFVWRPKGEQVLFTARFGCTDPNYNPEAARAPQALTLVTAPELAPTVSSPVITAALAAVPEARVWSALGNGYTQFIELAQKTYAHLATLQNTTIQNQNTQVLRLQKVVEELVGEHIKMRAGILEADGTRRVEGEEARVREELGKQFISEIGTFGRVVAAAKFGMAPELVELAEIVNASPELMEAMKAPEVRKMLRDEKTRKELAELLMMAARSAVPAPPPDQSAAA
jgi:hypothetical protein